MIFIAPASGFASLVLFGFAGALIYRASITPPPVIRTESRRSPAEYAFHRQQAAIRRSGYMCAMAAAVTLLVCVTTGVLLVSLDQ